MPAGSREATALVPQQKRRIPYCQSTPEMSCNASVAVASVSPAGEDGLTAGKGDVPAGGIDSSAGTAEKQIVSSASTAFLPAGNLCEPAGNVAKEPDIVSALKAPGTAVVGHVGHVSGQRYSCSTGRTES